MDGVASYNPRFRAKSASYHPQSLSVSCGASGMSVFSLKVGLMLCFSYSSPSLFLSYWASFFVMLGKGKLLLATSFHALINLGMLLLFEEEEGSCLAMGTLTTSCTIAAIFVVGLMRMKRQTTHIGETVERSNLG